MNSKHLIIVSITLVLLLSWKSYNPLHLNYPSDWPAPQYDFQNNPLDSAKIALGRILFYEPLLSRDSTISCASCHLSYTAFTHVDHALSHGINDRIGRRNSPALFNLAWQNKMMWDGRMNHLDMQALAPISDSMEMDFSIQGVVNRLNSTKRYQELANKMYPDSVFTGERVLKALSQFELTLISQNSKYDKVQNGELDFTDQEKQGLKLFEKHCAACHTPPLFSTYGFEKNGLEQDPLLKDEGRFEVSGLPEDLMKFKIPSLRNLSYSRPYMHDGRFNRLIEVIQHYEAVPELFIEKGMTPLMINEHDRTDLIAFLLTLNDRQFVFNQDFAYPKDE